MTTHTLNAAIARGGMEHMECQQQQLNTDRNTAQNGMVKQRPATSYGKEMEFKDFVKILTEWDEGFLDPPATKQNEVN